METERDPKLQSPRSGARWCVGILALAALGAGSGVARATEEYLGPSPPLIEPAEPEEELGPSPAVAEPVEEEAEGRKFSSLGIRGGPWYGILRGDFKLPAQFGPITGPIGPFTPNGTLSVSLDDERLIPWGELFATTRFIGLYADLFYARLREETLLLTDVTVDGVGFRGGLPVIGKARVLTASGRIQLNLLPLEFLELGISVGARYVDALGEVIGTDPLSGALVQESRRIQFPVPLAGASLTVFLGRHVETYGRAQGFFIHAEDWEAEHLEVAAGLAFNVGDHLSIGAEYHGFFLVIRDPDENEFDLRLQGPLAYIRLRF